MHSPAVRQRFALTTEQVGVSSGVRQTHACAQNPLPPQKPMAHADASPSQSTSPNYSRFTKKIRNGSLKNTTNPFTTDTKTAEKSTFKVNPKC